MATNAQMLEIAKKLAEYHRSADPSTSEIFLSPSQSEIRLIEVSKEVPNSNEVLAISFKAAPEDGIPYPSVVILLSPKEWDSVQSGLLALPESWGDYSSFIPLPKAC
jgi:hypothetical protein